MLFFSLIMLLCLCFIIIFILLYHYSIVIYLPFTLLISEKLGTGLDREEVKFRGFGSRCMSDFDRRHMAIIYRVFVVNKCTVL